MSDLRAQFETHYQNTGSIFRALDRMGYDITQIGTLPDDLKQAIGMDLMLPAVETVSPQCATCYDHGWITTKYYEGEQYKYSKTEPCPDCAAGYAAQQEVYQKRFKHAGIPDHFEKFTFETWETALTQQQKQGKRLGFECARLLVERVKEGHYFRLAEAYARISLKTPLADDPARNSLVLYGPLGVGKTGLTACIAHTLAVQKPVLYLRMQALIGQIQNTYQKGYEGLSRGELLQQVKQAPLLILDEMTLEKDSDDRKEIAEDIMRYRCNNERPFVVTTNHTEDDFRGAWGERTTDVMLEAAHWIPMGGDNLRRKAQPVEPI